MIENMTRVSRYRLGFFVVLAASFVFRLWFMTTLPLSGDESYHWEWSRNLAFGYYDHPGLTAYLIRCSTLIFGRSTEFTLRLPALLMLSGASVVCYLFGQFAVRERGGSEEQAVRAGFFAGLLMIVLPVFAAMSVYISTDPPLIFFWTLSLYLYYRAFHKGGWGIWTAAGAALGCAMLSKFLAFFLIMGIGAYVLLTREGRRSLLNPRLWLSGVVALAVFSPFLYWNATHEWATFMFNFVYRQKAESLDLIHVPEYILSQAALAATPGIFIFMIVGWRRMFREGREYPGSYYLAATSLVPLAYFLYVGTKQQVGLHWPVAAWVGPAVYVACYWEAWRGDPGKRAARQKRWALGFCIFLTVAIHAAIHIPPEWIHRVQWRYAEDPSRISMEKHAERFGWNEMGEWVGHTVSEMEARPGSEGVFIVCTQYGVASSVAFYTPGQPRTHLWAPQRTHGENYRFWDDFPSMAGQDAVFVVKRESHYKRNLARLAEHFESVGEVETLTIVRKGLELRSFYLIRCYNFNGVAPSFVRNSSSD